MKKVLYTFLLIFPAFIYAQQAPKTVPLIQKGEKTDNKTDTIVTKDPLDPSREHVIILNFKGVITEQGTKSNRRKDGVWREYSNGNGLLSKVTVINFPITILLLKYN